LIQPYMDLSAYVENFMGVLAIFNNNTNRFLLDNLSLRDFDKIRQDWELWSGTPEHWVAINFQLVALVPFYATKPVLGFDLYYVAKAPLVNDEDVPLVDIDYQSLFENYCVADLLESNEEFTKASFFWKEYLDDLAFYKERVSLRAKRDLILKA